MTGDSSQSSDKPDYIHNVMNETGLVINSLKLITSSLKSKNSYFVFDRGAIPAMRDGF